MRESSAFAHFHGSAIMVDCRFSVVRVNIVLRHLVAAVIVAAVAVLLAAAAVLARMPETLACLSSKLRVFLVTVTVRLNR